MDLFCPSCAHRLVVATKDVVWRRGVVLETTFVYCVGCALVSELSGSGLLYDLGRVDVEDLAAPQCGCPEHRLPVMALDFGNPLEGRKDS